LFKEAPGYHYVSLIIKEFMLFLHSHRRFKTVFFLLKVDRMLLCRYFDFYNYKNTGSKLGKNLIGDIFAQILCYGDNIFFILICEYYIST